MPIVAFTLKSYLDRLGYQNRQNIPTMADLADAAGLQPTPFSRLVNNHTYSIDKRVLANVIAELRRRGFRPAFDDLFEYIEQTGMDRLAEQARNAPDEDLREGW